MTGVIENIDFKVHFVQVVRKLLMEQKKNFSDGLEIPPGGDELRRSVPQ